MESPFWNTNEIRGEPVIFFRDGDLLRGTLLFPPEEIYSVEVWEARGGFAAINDYEIVELQMEGPQSILALRSEAIPCLKRDDLIRPKGSPDSYPSTRDSKRALIFSEEGLFHKLQTRVTYRHNEEWGGFIPRGTAGKLPRTKQTLAEGGDLDVLIFGDSISTGANCSKQLNLPPFAGSYPELLCNLLQAQNPRLSNRVRNESVGGQASTWGRKRLQTVLASPSDFGFDLNIIAWGMNDSTGRLKPRRYLSNIADQVKQIRAHNPASEFLFVASSLPNPAWNGAYPELLFTYARDLNQFGEKAGPMLAVANLTQLWQDLLQRKNYYDLTGNGINHPNDFGHLLYAQVIGTILGVYKNV